MRSGKDVDAFIRDSGFKVLALARLGHCDYSLVLYLINTAVSGLDQFVTTEAELASLIGYEEEMIATTLRDLASRNIVRLHYGAQAHDNASLRIGLEFDTQRWHLDYEEEATHQDAVVFPFRRRGSAGLQVVEAAPEAKSTDKKPGRVQAETWQRVLDSFVQGRSLDDDELEETERAARTLVDTHPVDQILLMLRHFGGRIPTLSLLASSWQHYQEIFEQETQKVDLLEARQKHQEQDTRVREQAQMVLERREEHELTEEEVTVLKILIKHRHPRRQLFWAYQARSRYPHLESFFADNAPLMLAVTTHGSVIKPPKH